MLTIRAELHVHTVLSACAELEMLPPLIVMEALNRGIKLIAVTDHNATANIISVQKAAEGTDLTVLPGMELQTREEVHVLCLFDDHNQINTFQQRVNLALPDMENRAEYFGDQLIVDEYGEFLTRESRLLATSVNWSIEDTWAQVNDLDGLLIPAHVNRSANGLLPILGIIPPGIPFPAMEISRHLKASEAIERFPQLKGYSLVQGGDAHQLDDITGANLFTVTSPKISEIKMALSGQDGRSIRVLSSTMPPINL